MTTEKKLLGTNPVATGGASPEAVSFDGVSDQLSRSSDLTGNADGKTFTFSAWVYQTGGNNNISMINLLNSGTTNFEVYANDGYLYITGWNTAHSTQVIEARLDLRVPIKTWSHVLISADMTSTSNRYVYVDDIDYSSTINWYSYSNADINFTNNNPVIGSTYASAGYSKGRLAHLFLDYTYRDLSIAANRRLFIDADGKPADGQADLSPILYLPMKDADTAGSNSGTGGDFTVNGILATAERGPEQDNCSASVFDGSNDYLSKTSITGMYSSNEKVITVSYIVQFTGSSFTEEFLWMFTNNSDTYMTYQDRTHRMRLGTGGSAMNLELTGNRWKANGQMTISIDLSDTSKRHVFFNGVDITSDAVFHSYNNTDIGFGSFTRMFIGSRFGTAVHYQGNIGEFYVNNVYHDLATDNPFWNSDTNLPNSVRKVISDTGVTPLIALPIIGSDAGKNYGSIGDFTVNSGPYTGARGGSEYWAGSAEFNSSTYFDRYTPANIGSTKTFTYVTYFKHTATPTTATTISARKSGQTRLQILINGASSIQVMAYDSSNVNRLQLGKAMTISNNEWHSLMVCVDMTDSSKTKLYFDGSEITGGSHSVQNYDLDLGGCQWFLGQREGGLRYTGALGFVYFDDSFIDFSQESNRNLFIDQLGFPVDLSKHIEDGTINEPSLQFEFKNSNDLGENSGTGGDFSSNSTRGSDVNP